MLVATQLSFGGQVMPYHQLDFTLSPGEILLIQGPSGIGKTSLLNIVAGFLTHAAGSLCWHGGHIKAHSPEIGGLNKIGREEAEPPIVTDLLPLPPWERPVSFLFQEGNFFNHLDCDTHLRLAFRPSAKITPSERDRIEHTLDRLGINGLAHRMPEQLSGGQAQRMALARALLRGHPLILLDEPFSALDNDVKEEAASLLKQLAEEDKCCFLVVSHDPDDAVRLNARTLMLTR